MEEEINTNKENQEVKVEERDDNSVKKGESIIWKVSTIVLGVLFIISLFTGGFGIKGITGSAAIEDSEEDSGALNVIILNDERCGVECEVTGFVTQLKVLFPNIKVEEVDYDSREGKKLYEDNDLDKLPAVLFTEEVKLEESYSNIASYTEERGSYLLLKIGATFDPKAEICDNKKDDDGDKVVDCEDSDCSSEWKCMDKKEVPEVELFVMSHCPYGTQVEKGILPVVELLGDKIKFDIKFCDYAMHDLIEINEQKAQYCIQKEQGSKFLDYLGCFLKDGKGDDCLEEVDVDERRLNTCVENTDKQFKISENYNDRSTWIGTYPGFDVNKDDVVKYEVRGSPTLVINGVVASTGRDPSSLLGAICTGFEDEPKECDEKLSSETPSPGFGFETTSSGNAAGACA